MSLGFLEAAFIIFFVITKVIDALLVGKKVKSAEKQSKNLKNK